MTMDSGQESTNADAGSWMDWLYELLRSFKKNSNKNRRGYKDVFNVFLTRWYKDVFNFLTSGDKDVCNVFNVLG